MFWAGNSLYLAATGGLCALELQSFLYELPYKGVLPVTVTSFTAQNIGSANRLQWQAFGGGIKSFAIERSNDGRNFTEISSVPGIKSGNLQQAYSFIDNNPLVPLSYYRLQYLDAGGVTNYSETRVVNSAVTSFTASLQSNMVQSQLILNFAANIQTQAEIAVYSADGKPLMQAGQQVPIGISSKTLDVGRLSKGIYIVRVLGSGKMVTLKFVML
jgi:hypothetical protein